MEVIAVHYESPDILLDRITRIIAIIPNPVFHEHASNWEGAAVHKLTEVKNNIKSSPSPSMDNYWNEVGRILNISVFTQKGPWVEEILKVIMEEF